MNRVKDMRHTLDEKEYIKKMIVLCELGLEKNKITNNPEEWRKLAQKYDDAGFPTNAEACRRRAEHYASL